MAPCVAGGVPRRALEGAYEPAGGQSLDEVPFKGCEPSDGGAGRAGERRTDSMPGGKRPLAYEPMLFSDLGKLETVGRAASEGSFEAMYEALAGLSFDRLSSIRSKEIDQEKKAFVSGCRDRVKKAVSKCREYYAAKPGGGGEKPCRDKKASQCALRCDRTV